ncbi:hypothetical protein C4N9_20935 [Pararhodobacter marinus]|uniref:Uncharacterized protein n=1 Tax=Pararhodobacter marinus TaxID=2184063 RepID=A0A2U2C4E0_9RHOB|nr:hypothetical protein [Pararhodobacter marinus]PWE26727.1 hypothetical protein C4N9_20935 [Pararhodobacter marinus]
MDLQSYIGATLSIAAGSFPATEDKSGYEGETYEPIGKILSIGEIGDQHAAIEIATLAGRNIRVVGIADGGAVEVVLAFDEEDAGQTDLTSINGSNTMSAFRIVDPAPATAQKVVYFGGLVASLRDNARTPTNYRGKAFQLFVNTAVLRTTAAA